MIIASCSSTKTSQTVAKKDIPPTYKRALFVTNNYYTNKNIVKKLFNTDIKNKLTISKLNTKIVNAVKEQLAEQHKYAEYYLVKNNLDKTLILTEEEIQQNIDEQLLDKNIDLLILIQQNNVNRSYTKLNYGEDVFNKNSYSATTDSSNLKYTYTFTGFDVSRDSIVFQSRYQVQNADNLFNKIPKTVAEKLIIELNEKHLY